MFKINPNGHEIVTLTTIRNTAFLPYFPYSISRDITIREEPVQAEEEVNRRGNKSTEPVFPQAAHLQCNSVQAKARAQEGGLCSREALERSRESEVGKVRCI